MTQPEEPHSSLHRGRLVKYGPLEMGHLQVIKLLVMRCSHSGAHTRIKCKKHAS